MFSFRKLVVLALVAALAVSSLSFVTAQKRLSCAVCESFVDEVNTCISSTRETHTVQARFRIDEKKHIPFKRSEYRLQQIFDEEAPDRVVNNWGLFNRQIERESQEKRQAELEARTVNATEEERAKEEEYEELRSASLRESREEFEKQSISHSLQLEVLYKLAHGAESDEKLKSEVKSTLEELLEDHTDEAIMLFHKDVANLKHKLCVDVMEACKKVKPKKKKPAKKTVKKTSTTTNTTTTTTTTTTTSSTSEQPTTSSDPAPTEPVKQEL